LGGGWWNRGETVTADAGRS